MDKRILSANVNTRRMMLIRFIALIALAITSPVGLLISIIFIAAFISIKINKIWFCIASGAIAFLLNLKISFMNVFGKGAIKIVENLILDSVFKKGVNCKVMYKVYLNNLTHNHNAMIWQVVIGIIIAAIVVQIYHSDDAIKKVVKNNNNDKKIDKAIKKLENLPHEDNNTLLGVSYKDQKTIKVSDKAKHIMIAGTTGSGKTVSISNFIESGMQKGYPIMAIDGKGDLDEGSLLHYMQSLSRKYGRKLYVVNLVKPEYSDYYNPFKGAGMTEAKDMLIDMSEWSEPHYKINTERYLQQVIRVLNLAKIPLNLNTIIRYSSTQFKKLILQLKNEDALTIDDYTKLMEIIEDAGQIADSAMARFATTAESEAGEIFNDNKGIDICEVMKERANILIILDSLGKPELSRQVGRLAILDAKKAVSKLFGDPIRKFFIWDEFNVYASDVAIDVLNKSRSAGVTCIPAVQSLADLEKAGGTALMNQVIDNCNNYIIMRQNSPMSSETWEKVIGQEEIMDYTYHMEEKPGLFGSKNMATGTGSMHKTLDNKYTHSDIQNLKLGETIFLSKDESVLEKVKVRFVNLDMPHPILDRNKIIPKASENSVNEIESTQNFNDIENMLNK